VYLILAGWVDPKMAGKVENTADGEFPPVVPAALQSSYRSEIYINTQQNREVAQKLCTNCQFMVDNWSKVFEERPGDDHNIWFPHCESVFAL
jgi:hypothetical protein